MLSAENDLKMSEEYFVFGIEGLDNMFQEALVPGTTMLIAGHPGAGKTTLAATICYKNALRGKPCLYISFNERYEKFLRQMAKFGMNFKPLEKKRLFKFIRLPIISSKEIIDILGDTLTKALSDIKAKVLIIDSATPISETLKAPEVSRSVLQNFFYDITTVIQGLIVLIEELPLGRQTLATSDIEFVADAVILMKHRIDEALLVRTIEFRKFRGAPLNVSEVPFSIREQKGIQVFAPITLENVPPPKRDVAYYFPCTALERAIRKVYPGTTVLIATPPHARSARLGVTPFIALSVLNDLTMGIISYRYSSEELKWYISLIAGHLGIPSEEVIKRLKFAEGINPTAYSLEELLYKENELIDKHKPNMVFFHAPELIVDYVDDLQRYRRLLYNQLLFTKVNNIITFRYVSPSDERHFMLQASVSDIVFRITYRKTEGGTLRPEVYVWRSGYEPRILDCEVIEKCVQEMKERIWQKLNKAREQKE